MKWKRFANLNLSNKITLMVVLLVVAISVSLSTVIGYHMRHTLEDRLRETLQEKTHRFASLVAGELGEVLGQVRGLQRAIEAVLQEQGRAAARSLADPVLQHFAARKHDLILGVGLILDSDGEIPPLALYCSRDMKGKALREVLTDYENEAYYRLPKLTRKEVVLEPFEFRVAGKITLMTMLLAPIFDPEENFVGVVGVDIPLVNLHALLNAFHGFEDLNVNLFSASGKLVTGSVPKFTGLSVNAIYQDPTLVNAVLERESGFFTRTAAADNIPVLSYLLPFSLANTDTRWSVVMEIPLGSMHAKLYRSLYLATVAACVVGLIAVLLTLRVTRKLSLPLVQINARLKSMSQGDLLWAQELNYGGRDEIGEIVQSVQQLKDNIQSTIEQARAIAQGDYERPVLLHSAQDQLGLALHEMTTSLRAAAERSQAEDWLKSGQTGFSAALSGEQTPQELAEHAINFICPHLGAQVGLFYHYEAESRRLVLRASYAFVHRKHGNNQFALGEGPVGQAGLERKMIVLTQVPPEYYYRIRSGIGGTLPKMIAVMPFLYENNLKGVLELATLHEFNDQHLMFLKQTMPILGIAVHSTESRLYLKNLSQRQAAEAQPE